MKLILPFLSLFVLLLTGETLARPSFAQKRGHNATLAALIAKRQTNRNQINVRAHVKETVKRVKTQLAVEREEVIAGRSITTVSKEERSEETIPLATRAQVYARQAENSPAPGRKRALPAPATRANLYARQAENSPAPGRKRALPAPATRANVYARQAENSPAPGRKRALPGSNEKRRQQETEVVQRVYPKCQKTSARTGYAHYPGWKLVGDELSGALPVKPESACIQACNRYGGACSGVFFDSEHGKCYLKGTKTSEWDFTIGEDADGVDLVGGCDLWSNIVPEEMDATCCRD